MSLAAKIARGTILQTVGKVISVTIGWIVVVLMTNALGAAVFGEYTTMTAFVQFFGVSADIGFILVSAQLLGEWADKSAEDRQHLFQNLFTFRLVTAVAVLVLAPIVVQFLPYSSLIKTGVTILTLSFLGAALIQVFTGVFQQQLTPGRMIAAELTGRVVLLGGTWFAILRGASLISIVEVVVLASAVSFAMAMWLARGVVSCKLSVDRNLWREIWSRAWPMALGIVFNLVYLKTDTLILSFVRPSAEVGVYGAMYRIFEVLVTFPTMFAGLLLPVMAAAKARGDYDHFKQTAQHGVDALLFGAVPMVVGIIVLAKPITALFGPEFVSGVTVLQMLAVATGMIFIGTFLGHVLVAANKQRSFVPAYAVTAAISLIGYLIFIPKYGMTGGAAMTVVAELLIAVLAYAALQYFLQLKISFKKFWIALGASVVMALAIYVVPQSLIIAVPTGAIVYLFALYLFGGFDKEFVRSLFQSSSTGTRSSSQT